MLRKLFFWALLIALVLLWAFSDKLFPPETIRAETARVTDGDTLTLNGTAYRLYGIDAPEYRQLCKDAAGKDWPCGKAARLQLAASTASGSIVCETRAADQYGRKVAKCASATVPDLAEAMVAAGLAISPAERGEAPYDAAQSSARLEKRGIWQGMFATPADWREANPRKDVP